MNGIHDMGGMHGFGQVQIEANEPVFHEPWEGRVMGLISQVRHRLAAQQPSRRMIGRPVMENMEPAAYLNASYYERFLFMLERNAIMNGLVTEAELRERIDYYRERPEAPMPRHDDPQAAQRQRAALRVQGQPASTGAPPRFGVGDHVRARNFNPIGHTRLPRYVRGKHGVIVRVNGWYAIQDADASALGPNPQAVYTARFDAREVWGPDADSNLGVYLELWEGYLEPA